LAGLVGAGRSEIARTIFGLSRASSGSVEVFGKVLKSGNPKDSIKAGLVYVTEDRKADGLLLNRPVIENITAGNLKPFFKFPCLRLKAEWNFAREMTSRFDIRTRGLRTPLRILSACNQQKVLIARAVGLGPKILILDEPTRGVDIGAKQEIYSMIEALAAKGIAIILISSEMAELLRLSENILVLREGHISANLTFVILTAGIDLSVGAILGLCVVLFADILQTQSLAVAIPVGLLCGGLMGIFNGLGVAYARIPAFIMTLGMLTFWRGIAFICTSGTPIPIVDATYYYVGNGYLAGIPIPSIILLLTLFAAAFVLHLTPFGRCVYAIGSNEDAAHCPVYRPNDINCWSTHFPAFVPASPAWFIPLN
jgi:ABC-type branched-subunit amino acid transport system ATPase component